MEGRAFFREQTGCGRRSGLDHNHGANFVQINPNKTKQICLDFLGFIRPNWDFSTGYARKN
jgi:hypothetical protein